MDLDAVQIDELADSLVASHDDLLRSLVAMRKRHSLSQDAVAERMGVSQPTVAAFERYDANPTLATIRRYALAVGASIDHVVADRCCSHTREDFEVVVSSVTHPWTQSSSMFDWGWAPGKVRVHATF